MKVVIQTSGGIDSTTLIGKAIKQFGKENVYLIAFDTDTIFWRNRDSVAIKRVVTNLQMQQQLFICRMPQMDQLEHVIDSDFEDVGFIPGFKMLFNTASLAWAQRVGASEVWIGNMEENVYPDEKQEFLSDLAKLYAKTYPETEPVKIVTPLFGYTKAEVIKEGFALGLNLYQTVSCGDDRLSGGYNCGRCPWCARRIQGFNESMIEDRTTYVFGRGLPYNNPDYKTTNTHD